MNTFTRTILASSLAFACAQASAAEFGAWHQVQKGVIERTNADGSSSRATYGPAGAQYTYDRGCLNFCVRGAVVGSTDTGIPVADITWRVE